MLSESQQINNCGHFTNSPVKSDFSDFQKLVKSELAIIDQFSGEKLFAKTVDKLITITTVEQNIPSILRLYTLSGTLLFEKQFSQIINPELTANNNYISFFCRGRVNLLNLKSLLIKSCKSSIIYCIDSAGNPVCFDDSTSKITYKDKTLVLNEIPSKILHFKDKILIFSRNNLYVLAEKEIQKILVFDGAFFEAQIQMDTLNYVTKKKLENAFQFRLYKSANLQNFIQTEESYYQTNKQIIRSSTHPKSKNSVLSGLHESIRGPLNYDIDNMKYSIGNSYDELQDYGSGAYLHPGVDFLGNPNQEVYAVKTGIVKAILTTGGDIYWRVGVANNKTNNESIGYLYAHINKTSIPYAVGDSIYAGHVIGTIVPWPVTGFNHVHFARIKESGAIWDANWWTVNDPLSDVINLVDTIKPVFEKTINNDLLAFRDLNGIYLSANNIHGNVDIVSKVSDRCNSNYKIDVFELSYSLTPLNSPLTSLLNQLAFRFDMPSDDYIGNSVYSKLMTNTIYSFDQTCLSKSDYNNRHFYHIISNSNGGDSITAQSKDLFFKSTDYPDGQYYFKLIAKDAKMNVSMDSMIISINNAGAINTSVQNVADITVFQNSSNNCIVIKLPLNGKSMLTIYNAKGQQVYISENIADPELKIQTDNWQRSVYIYKLINSYGTVRTGKIVLK